MRGDDDPVDAEALKRARVLLGDRADGEQVNSVARELARERREKEQERREKEQEREEKERLLCTAFTEEQWPSIGTAFGSSSGTSKQRAVEPCAFRQGTMALLQPSPVRQRRFKSLLFAAVPESTSLWLPAWGSEADIQQFVRAVLVDVIRGLGYERRVQVEMNLGVAGLFPDVWLVCAGPCPVGVVEVKKPGADDETADGRVLGQLFDQMQMLRSSFGQEWVFGVVASYWRWRICWLGDTGEVAACNVLPDTACELEDGLHTHVVDHRQTVAAAGVPDVVRYGPVVAVRREGRPADDAAERELRGTDVYDVRECGVGIDLAEALASMIVRMVRSPRRETAFLSTRRVYQRRRAAADGDAAKGDWHALAGDLGGLDLGRLAQANSVYLLLDLGGGGDGRVFLGMSERGLSCVVKFSRERERAAAQSALTRECEMWRRIWGFEHARVADFGVPALVMPYVRMAGGPAGVDRAAVEQAARRCAAAGFAHLDLSWRHVGQLRRDGVMEVVFVDLGRVRSIDAAEAGSAACDMIGMLYR